MYKSELRELRSGGPPEELPPQAVVCLVRSRNGYAASIHTHLSQMQLSGLSRRCRPMPASSSMTARAVANGSSPSRAIAACSALTAQCRVRRYRATCVAACQGFIKCREALKARSAIQWNIKRVDRARQGGEASPVRRFIVARGVGPRRSGSSQQVVTLTHLSMFPVGSAS